MEPIRLTTPIQRLIANLLKLGLFEAASLLLFLGSWAYDTWTAAPCYTRLYPTYYHTGTLLIGMFAIYLLLCLIQTICLTKNTDRPEQDYFGQALRRLYLSTLLRATPALLMLLSLVALPDYRVLYLLAALLLLPARFLAGRHHDVAHFSNIPTWQPKTAKRLLGLCLSLTSLTVCTRLALPNFASDCKSRWQISAVKAQMLELQTQLESAAIEDEKGYPTSVQSLLANADANNQANPWPPLNVCMGLSNPNSALMNAADASLLTPTEILGFRFDHPPAPSRCMVLYENISPSEYRIYGTDPTGALIRDKEQAFVLSPS